MAMKLDHDEPFVKPHQGYLLMRVDYDKDFVEKWMYPRILYFSKCLMTRTKPPTSLFKDINKSEFPKIQMGPEY